MLLFGRPSLLRISIAAALLIFIAFLFKSSTGCASFAYPPNQLSALLARGRFHRIADCLPEAPNLIVVIASCRRTEDREAQLYATAHGDTRGKIRRGLNRLAGT